MVERAKDSLSSLRELMEKDDLLKNLDKNDMPGFGSMEVVGQMKDRLKDIADALPR